MKSSTKLVRINLHISKIGYTTGTALKDIQNQNVMVFTKTAIMPYNPAFRPKGRHSTVKSVGIKSFNNNSEAVKARNSRRKYLLLDSEVPSELRTPHIVRGYRYWNLSVVESLKSLFYGTNETINVWSHAIAFVLFVLRFYTVFSWKDHQAILNPLLAFALSILVLMATSSLAHLFCSLSTRAHHIGYYFDYAAISFYAFCGALMYFFYCRPLGEEAPFIFQSALAFHVVAAVSSVACTAVNCISRHRWHKSKFVIRTFTVAVNFLFDISPYAYRWLTCGANSCFSSEHYFKRHLVCYLVSAIANATKLPERLIPGVFDFLGQSHHFLHVLSAFGAADAFTTAQIDLRERRHDLVQFTPHRWFENSLLWMAAVFVLNFSLVVFFIAIRIDKQKGKNEAITKNTNDHQE